MQKNWNALLPVYFLFKNAVFQTNGSLLFPEKK